MGRKVPGRNIQWDETSRDETYTGETKMVRNIQSRKHVLYPACSMAQAIKSKLHQLQIKPRLRTVQWQTFTWVCNYLPVSLTCVPCKLLEHIVCSNMAHLDEYKLLSDRQHAFRKRHSCETQLTQNVCTKANRTLGFLRRNLYSCPPGGKRGSL